MKTPHLALLGLLLALAACSRDPSRAAPGHARTSTGGPCGMSPEDWCPAPAGDPCGAHEDVRSCRADARCKGMPYSGESVVACTFDDAGYGVNCPTVGCISR